MKRKFTDQIDDQLLYAVRTAVEGGSAQTMSEFVQDALKGRLKQLRRDKIRHRIESAASDPLFVEDVRETTRAYGVVDDGGLS